MIIQLNLITKVNGIFFFSNTLISGKQIISKSDLFYYLFKIEKTRPRIEPTIPHTILLCVAGRASNHSAIVTPSLDFQKTPSLAIKINKTRNSLKAPVVFKSRCWCTRICLNARNNIWYTLHNYFIIRKIFNWEQFWNILLIK